MKNYKPKKWDWKNIFILYFLATLIAPIWYFFDNGMTIGDLMKNIIVCAIFFLFFLGIAFASEEYNKWKNE